MSAKLEFTEATIAICLFLIFQFFSQIGIFFLFKRLGTPMNNDLPSEQEGRMTLTKDLNMIDEEQALEAAMKVSVAHYHFLTSSLKKA
jgi:hypothetical protein